MGKGDPGNGRIQEHVFHIQSYSERGAPIEAKPEGDSVDGRFKPAMYIAEAVVEVVGKPGDILYVRKGLELPFAQLVSERYPKVTGPSVVQIESDGTCEQVGEMVRHHILCNGMVKEGVAEEEEQAVVADGSCDSEHITVGIGQTEGDGDRRFGVQRNVLEDTFHNPLLFQFYCLRLFRPHDGVYACSKSPRQRMSSPIDQLSAAGDTERTVQVCKKPGHEGSAFLADR